MLNSFSPGLAIKESPPLILLPWLVYEQSLTEKLRNRTGNVQLKVINQHWTMRSWWDEYVLNTASPIILQREIIMFASQQACWYARTVIPESSFKENEAFFNRLEKESLGEIIFGNPRVKRYSLVHYAVNAGCIEYYWPDFRYKANAEELWVRLASFTINNYPFYLVEILLPGLLIIES